MLGTCRLFCWAKILSVSSYSAFHKTFDNWFPMEVAKCVASKVYAIQFVAFLCKYVKRFICNYICNYICYYYMYITKPTILETVYQTFCECTVDLKKNWVRIFCTQCTIKCFGCCLCGNNLKLQKICSS